MTPDERQRRREGSRRAQSARSRRAAAAEQRRGRGLVYTLVGVVLIAAAIAAFVLLRGGGTEVGYAVPLLPASHNPPYVWIQEIDEIPGRIPPTSGHHYDLPHQGWGFLGEPLVPERVIHNMEHGGVVFWHQPDDPELAGAVNRLVRETGDRCVVAGSYSDMSYRVVATVWGRALPLDEFDAEQLLEFTNAYRGTQGPEAGLCNQEAY